jgi:hypothetical protein
MKNSNTNSDNKPNQTPNRSTRQAKKQDERTSDAGYQKLPLKFRPKAGRDQCDPIDYDSHPYPSMGQFADFPALRFNTPRTRHSYYRQIRLVHEFSLCDPLLITEELYATTFFTSKPRSSGSPRPFDRLRLPPACFSRK